MNKLRKALRGITSARRKAMVAYYPIAEAKARGLWPAPIATLICAKRRHEKAAEESAAFS
ncbi:hypothetical protein [Herminiimonas aquatilis]|uniref:Uncharacterized protein n=1 Tax=Herminiimonas aquatilis TaxID=345342 RepID=A0ABW2J4R7_9BURK